jgi:hypothetical protein
MRPWREASLSCRCHGICLNIDFHDNNRDGESYVGYDCRFVMVVRCIGCDEDLMHMFFLCVRCLVTAAAALTKRGWHCIFGGAPLVWSSDFHSKSPRSGLHWCTWRWPCWRNCFVELGFLYAENLRSLIGRQQLLCTIYLLDELLLKNVAPYLYLKAELLCICTIP